MKPRLCCSLWDIAVGWALPRLKHDKLLSTSFEVPRRSLQHSRPLGFNMCVLRSHEGLAESFCSVVRCCSPKPEFPQRAEKPETASGRSRSIAVLQLDV